MNNKITRCLTVYDGASEEVELFFELENYNLKEFMFRFDVNPTDDPEMLDRYAIGPDEVSFLKAFLNEEIIFDFSNKGYFVEAVLRE